MSLDMKEDRPAYVRFEKRPVEDRNATIQAGHYVARDVDYALVTPPYSRDCHEQEAAVWLAQMDVEVSSGRLPATWRDNYKAAYEAWKKGEEIPVEGTPIKGWQLFSPAQQKNAIELGFRTVEDLAGMNAEGLQKFGIGGQDAKNKAQAWLKAANGPGKLAGEISALQVAVSQLQEQNRRLEEQNKEMAAELESRTRRKAA